MGVMDKFLNYMKLNDEDEYDTDDDYLDDDDYVDEPVKKPYKEQDMDDKPAARKTTSKVTPMPKSNTRRMQNSNGMEVCVIKPTSV